MALTLPNPEDLQSYIEGQTEEQSIQQAMDLFVLATGLNATSSALEDRLVKSAVLDMAWAIRIRHEDKESEFSSFSGERIGSYSYNKALRDVSSGQATNVPNFDSAVAYFLAQAIHGVASVSSEFVFETREMFTREDILVSPAPITVVENPEVFLDDDGSLYVEVD